MVRLTTKQIALIAVFAALIVIVTQFKGIPILGGQGGGQIAFSTILYPVIGLVLGPWIGFFATLLGNFIAWTLAGSLIFGLGFLMIPAGAIAALVSGSLSWGVSWSDWRLAGIILIGLNAFWYFSPVGLEAPFYPILHIVALILVVIFRDRISEWMQSPSDNKMVFGTAICSYIATMAEHMTGNLIYISLFGTENLGQLFMMVLPISALERIIITVAATILGVTLIRVIGRGRLIHSDQQLVTSTDKKPLAERSIKSKED